MFNTGFAEEKGDILNYNNLLPELVDVTGRRSRQKRMNIIYRPMVWQQAGGYCAGYPEQATWTA